MKIRDKLDRYKNKKGFEHDKNGTAYYAFS